MDFSIPHEAAELLAEIDTFIASQITPLEQRDDNIRFFDHRREWSRTDFEAGGVPRAEWTALLAEARRRADAAGLLRYGLPEQLGGRDGSNLTMAIVREHLARKGLGLHNDLQDESSIVGNFPIVQMLWEFGSPGQREEFCDAIVTGERRVAFGLTEPQHGSDATWLETTASHRGDVWVISGTKRFTSGVHTATHDLVFARTAGNPGDADGITAFLVPTDAPEFEVPFFWWTFNMPTDHAEVHLRDVEVPRSAVVGEEGRGLALVQRFVHENRIRQAAASLGAAQHCINQSANYARTRITFGRPLAERQAIQWPLAELHTEAEMLRALVHKTAWELDRRHHMAVTEKVSMCNYRANRLACDAADWAMQVHGGLGYTRHTPFEHIYRHHRRYRITEGSDEIQLRRIAHHLLDPT